MSNLPMPLNDWLVRNQPDDQMLWKGAFESQVKLFTVVLPQMLGLRSQDVKVVSEHISKSIDLPVVLFEIPGKGTITVSDNFYYYTISVNFTASLEYIVPDWLEVFAQNDVHSVYAYGFRKEWVYGSLRANRQLFTIQVPNPDDIKRLFSLISQAVVAE